MCLNPLTNAAKAACGSAFAVFDSTFSSSHHELISSLAYLPLPLWLPIKPPRYFYTSVSVAEGFINCKRGVKYYQPLLQHEKQISVVISKALSKPIADVIRPKGSRLAHLYDLPRTHKEQLAMRPILSTTHTCNYAWAKWLDKRLKPLCVLFTNLTPRNT